MPDKLTRQQVLDIVYVPSNRVRAQRLTQDTPISTDVWVLYGTDPGKSHGLLLTPNRRVGTQDLFIAARAALKTPRLIYNQSHVLARLTFEELVCGILPLSMWWSEEIVNKDGWKSVERLLNETTHLRELLLDPAQLRGGSGQPYSETLLHMVRIVGLLGIGKPLPGEAPSDEATLREAVQKVLDLYGGANRTLWAKPESLNPPRPPLWRVFPNRPAEGAIFESRLTVKADAASELFRISCEKLRWAVIDSGIDATHPAFTCGPDLATKLKNSRIGRTYDFTRLRDLLFNNFEHPTAFAGVSEDSRDDLKDQLQTRVKSGQAIDWDLLEPVLRMPHQADVYQPPENEHGTHVAGIIAGNWKKDKDNDLTADLIGMCPDLQLYDVRVFDQDGAGDEFTVLAALQFIRHINQHRDSAVIQGVNLSFSLKHSVESFACGSTPVCEECDRLVAAGVVVVAAAGNLGFDKTANQGFGSFHPITITDPGNAEEVITVGATHRQMPHKYGVSYFSSRGPTGDGRLKPDLLAPGEKITSSTPNNSKATLDGTSMAAPHVSGAAALLMARHKELIGEPRRIKEILCKTATDLGRDRSFQGAGMVDILRALQSV